MRTTFHRAAAGFVAAAVGITLLTPVGAASGADGDPSICSGGSLAGRFSSTSGTSVLVEGTDRGTIHAGAGAQVRVVGTVQNSVSGLFTGPSEWNLHPFVSGVTEKNTTSSVDTTWTNAGATGLIEVRLYDNSRAVNSTRFEFTFTVTGPVHGSCQPPATRRVAPEEVLGDLSSRSYRHAACGQATATDSPVTTSTGNFWHTFEDLVIPGRGFPLVVRRTYNAHPGSTVPDGPLGHGWSFTYGVSLAVGASSVVLREEAGSRVTFSGTGPAYTAPGHITATLVRDQPSAGMFTLTRQADEILEFDAQGRLVAQRDLNGHRTTLAYLDGRLDAVTDASGRTLRFGWVGSRLKSLTDANEPTQAPRVVTFNYGAGDTGPDLTEVVDVTGGRTSFAYDADHRMTRMRMPNQYDPAVAVESDPEVVANVYDAQGRVSSQTDPLGRTTTFDYTSVPGSTIVTEPSTLDAAGNVVSHVRRDEYVGGLLVSQTLGYGTAEAATWTRAYDHPSLGCTRIVDPNGGGWTATYDDAGNRTSVTDPLERTTTWTYNANNRLTTMVDPRGNRPGADPARWTTTFSYDDAGCACNLVRRERPLLDADGTAVVAVEAIALRYGERGNHPSDPTTVVDPEGKEWTTDYDAHGFPVASADPLGHRSRSVFDAWGRKRSETVPRGNLGPVPDPAYTTGFTYDADSRLRTTTTPNPPGPAITTAAAYDANRNLVSVTDANANATTYEYDAADQARFVRRADGTSTETQYWPDGSLRAQVDGAGAATRYFFDPHGRVATVVDPLGRATGHGYDDAGNHTTTTDPGGDCEAIPHVGCTTFGYDAADQLESITYSDSTTANVTDIDYAANGARTAMTQASKASPPVTSTSSWRWDSLDRLVSATDANGATVGYTYDRRGSLRTIAYPGGTNTVVRDYDDAGRWTAVTDWLGNTTRFDYDEDDNLTARTGPSAAGVVDTFDYDNPGRLRSIAVDRAADRLASFTYGRDPAGQVRSEASTGVGADERHYAYTKLNQLCAVAATAAPSCEEPPAGAQVFAYDAADNLARMGDDRLSADAANQLCWTAPTAAPCGPTAPAAATTYTHDDRGNRTGATAASGQASTYAYDQARRLVSVRTAGTGAVVAAGSKHVLARAADGTVRAFGANGYGQLGNGTVWAWGANSTGQLGNGTTTKSSLPVMASGVTGATAVAAGGSHTLAVGSDRSVWSWGQNYYGQLGDGSLTSRSQPAAVPGTAGAVAVAGGAAFSLALRSDASLASWGTNSSGQLGTGTTTSRRVAGPVTGLGPVVAAESVQADYTYDGDGLRMGKTTPAGAVSFAWDASAGVPLLLREASAASATHYVYGPGGVPLQRIDASGEVLWYHQDQLGSTRLLTDGAGSVVATATYDPYGTVASATGVSQPFGFAGQYTDAETGFQYLPARYYDPATGQFLTRDPLEPVTGTPYAYANNSPLNFTDPSGEIPLVAAVALAWGAVEVGLSAWDAVGTARTVLDRCASGASKLAAIGLFAAGIVGPGAGYGSLDDLSRSGGRLISGDLTRAGQKLEQHQGGLFPKVFGSAAEKRLS